MKERIKREQNKLILVYGVFIFIAGLIGVIFPKSINMILMFCLIFGGTTILTGLTYIVVNKKRY